MPLRRVVALAQALTMILLLAPGLDPVGPALVQAAAVPPRDASATNVFDASGKGIGCQAGTRKYKGPGLPKDPPWPPGAEPTPSPTPQPSPGPSSQPEASAVPSSAGPGPEATTEAAVAMLAAEVEVPVTQPPAAAEPTPRPRRSKLLTGIDISHHNGNIDFGAVRDAGHRFVFVKATQDLDFVDSMFPTNVARARAAGLATGAYHFFDYTLDGKAQADHFLNRVEAANGIDGSLPPVVDVECWVPIGSSIHAIATARLRDFVQRVYERTARMPIVYTSVRMWQEVVGNAEGFEGLPLWAACWGCDVPPSLAPGWDDWVFWQTGLSRIPGVGRVDGNYFSGKQKDLDAMKLRPFSIAGGAVASGGGKVELDLGGRDATHLRTSPDGEQWSDWSPIRSVPTATIPTDEGEHTIYAQFRNGPGMRSPVFSDSIFVDATPPEVSTPAVALRLGPVAAPDATIPISVTWQARDAHAGLADATVQVSCGQGRDARSDAPGSAAAARTVTWDATAALFSDATCEVTAVAPDNAGNQQRATSDPVVTAVIEVGPDQPAAADVSGRQVGVIARRGPDGGRASISVDGQAVGLVDLYAPAVGEPEIVYITDLDGTGQHVSVEPTGTADPSSTGTSVIIDSFVSLGAGS
jgi:GH25 family lysozyme M1 (1,4-beta-N-acetylmuramidase)